MKRLAVIALAVSPFLAVGGGIIAARLAAADTRTHCEAPTVMLDMSSSGGQAIAAEDEATVASCRGDQCRVEGPAIVEAQVDGRVQCVELNSDMQLALTRRDGQVSLIVEERR